jgi:hypothetical protein
MTQYRVSLEGVQAALGRVPAADVARLLLHLERAAAQTAAVVLGQPKTTTGRYKGPIEQAVHFRLVGIEEGSVVGVLELPSLPFDPGATLDLEDPRLGEMAMEALMEAGEEPSNPAVAKALLDVADGLHIGERYEAVTLDAGDDHGQAKHVKIDGEVRRRLRAYVDSAPIQEPREGDLSGMLVEADFEKHTARLRTPTETAIDVSFSDEQADVIQAALRQRSTVRGDVAYDPTTNVARSVRLMEIVPGIEQLVLGASEFWQALSFEELAERQGSGRPVDPDGLYDPDATDEERDAFMAAIAELDR